MRKEIAGALLWFGTRAGIVRKKVSEERAPFEDGVVAEANAEVVFGAIPNTGSRLSEKETALRRGGAEIHDTDLLGRIGRGDNLLTESDVPLGGTREE
jgi:hypothetical protein